MKRYRFLIIFLALVMPAISFAQGGEKVNPKLEAKYSQEYLNKLQADHPERMAYLNYYADNACYVIDMPGKKVQCLDLQKLAAENGMEKMIDQSDLVDFNMFKFNIVPSFTERKYYKAGNTGKMIVVRAEKEVEKMYQNVKSTK